jgi:polyphosphate kinase 2 (PPK2 family)
MLENLDPTKKLKRKEWEDRREPLYRRLRVLQTAACRAGMPAIVLFEGWDVAGKGPCIAALTQALDPRGFKALPIRPPQAHELNYPWLWRFWMKLPPRGEIAIFDRSWYRRPLAERIERRLCEDDCRLALRDIGDLERTLADDGYLFVKIWLHIGQDEQRRRLRLRAKHDPGARQMRSLEQNRRYEEYLLAVEETLARTHARWAQWTVVEATDPFYAWWQVCETVAGAMAGALQARGVDLDRVDLDRVDLDRVDLDRLDDRMLAGEDGVGAPCAGGSDEGSIR